MKIQLRGQSMRLRIDESELESLLMGMELVNISVFSAGTAYRQALCLGDDVQARLESADTNWKLCLPDEQVRGYASSLPCREGLAFTLPAGPSSTLNVTFEVDVRDSIRVRGAHQREHECAADLERLI
jgi:hypothetical protein